MSVGWRCSEIGPLLLELCVIRLHFQNWLVSVVVVCVRLCVGSHVPRNCASSVCGFSLFPFAVFVCYRNSG
ncbi:hypothetical protein BDY21DRAFT_342040 [Lineolata rhizophorae]|uniref:Uncharacterized protein n=1 Tax=Lineolata rhizophorae TaxID=578093 RepID=A0A6A6P2S9_9PEZI|nr:hypothetical protein BDY21DRAFT_342040 [Lineolata rhizophorae]